MRPGSQTRLAHRARAQGGSQSRVAPRTRRPGSQTRFAHQARRPRSQTRLAHEARAPGWHTGLAHRAGTPGWHARLADIGLRHAPAWPTRLADQVGARGAWGTHQNDAKHCVFDQFTPGGVVNLNLPLSTPQKTLKHSSFGAGGKGGRGKRVFPG